MIKWDSLINRGENAVKAFAVGSISGDDFSRYFSGNPNPARQAVRTHGTTYSRRLARKALKRRGLLK